MTVQVKINQNIAEWHQFIAYKREKSFEKDHKLADYKHERAKFLTAYKANNPGVSQAAAETAADADDRLHSLYLERLLSESEHEACKDKLIWHRGVADNLRSEKVDERESNRLYADNPGAA